jgi:hypothetical protein
VLNPAFGTQSDSQSWELKLEKLFLRSTAVNSSASSSTRSFTSATTSLKRHIHAGCRRARHQLHLAFGGLLAHVDAVGNAHQIRILEFDAGALVSVIEQHVEARGFQLRGQLFAGLAQRASATLVTVTTTVKGAIEAGSQKPFLSFDCSMAAVRMRSMPMP